MWEEAKPGTEDIRWWIWALDAEMEQGQCQLCVERYHIYTHDCYQNVTEHTVYKNNDHLHATAPCSARALAQATGLSCGACWYFFLRYH